MPVTAQYRLHHKRCGNCTHLWKQMVNGMHFLGIKVFFETRYGIPEPYM